MIKSEKGFTQTGIMKTDNLVITALAWLNGDILVAGTDNTMLYFIEGGELKIAYNATEVDVIDLSIVTEE